MPRDKAEYKCKCSCGLVNMDEQLVEIDNKVIEKVNFKPEISSACRCIVHNQKVDGAKRNSAHICDEKDEKCQAIDYVIENSWRRAVITLALWDLGIKRIGFGNDFLHFDIDQNKPSPCFWIY